MPAIINCVACGETHYADESCRVEFVPSEIVYGEDYFDGMTWDSSEPSDREVTGYR